MPSLSRSLSFSLLSAFCFQAGNIVLVSFIGVVAAWNGANFYIEVFSRKYEGVDTGTTGNGNGNGGSKE